MDEAYKVVRSLGNGRYGSLMCYQNGEALSEYVIGRSTMYDYGPLMAFEDLESARDFLARLQGDHVLNSIATNAVIFKCQVEQVEGPSLILAFNVFYREPLSRLEFMLRGFWNGLNEYDIWMKDPPPFGTIFCSSVKLLGEVSSG